MQYNLLNISAAASSIVAQLNPGSILALHGDMGAGKTTLSAAICAALGVQDHMSSPTYSIINEYQGSINSASILIAHMDWYRLEDAEKIIDAGVLDYIQNDEVICIIEWSELAPELLPKNTLHIYIKVVNEHTREILMLPFN